MKAIFVAIGFLTAVAACGQSPFPCEEAESSGPAIGGELANQMGAYQPNNTYFLKFDALFPMLIDSVRVYANGAASRTFALLSPQGDIDQTVTLDVPDGESWVVLGFEVPAGSGFGLNCINQDPQLWRDAPPSELNYPYPLGDLGSITGTNIAGANTYAYYYYFYEWHVSPNGAAAYSGGYPCWNVELLDVEPIEALGGGDNGNDCWGWADPETGRELALFCRSNGMAIIDVTDPTDMKYFANVSTATVSSLWRDVKVYSDHAFIVSEAGAHGMQVVDLQALLSLPLDQVTEVEPVAYYTGFGNAHNIAMNEETGFAYGVGTSTFGGGLHIIRVDDPANPILAGSFNGYYSHDVHPVVYHGPDLDYQGREMVFCFNGGSGFAIVDAEDKSDVQLVSTLTYNQLGYTHQGWLSEDHRFCYMNDELDETNFGNPTRTYIVDIEDLDNPSVIGYFEAPVASIDHNMYVIGDKLYQSNYLSGLRVLDAVDPANGILELVGYFDTNPESDAAVFEGTWSNYPYFPSGNIAISTFSHFFMVRPSEAIAPEVLAVEAAPKPAVWSVSPNPALDVIRLTGAARGADAVLMDASGREVRRWSSLPRVEGLHLDVSAYPSGLYFLSLELEGEALGTAKRLVIQN
jgi:choice-of-anchor B domain-containing protein